MDDYSAQPEPIRVYENTYKLALDDGTKFAMRPGPATSRAFAGRWFDRSPPTRRFDSKVAQELLLRILDEKLEYLNEVDGKGCAPRRAPTTRGQ